MYLDVVELVVVGDADLVAHGDAGEGAEGALQDLYFVGGGKGRVEGRKGR